MEIILPFTFTLLLIHIIFFLYIFIFYPFFNHIRYFFSPTIYVSSYFSHIYLLFTGPCFLFSPSFSFHNLVKILPFFSSNSLFHIFLYLSLLSTSNVLNTKWLFYPITQYNFLFLYCPVLSYKTFITLYNFPLINICYFSSQILNLDLGFINALISCSTETLCFFLVFRFTYI